MQTKIVFFIIVVSLFSLIYGEEAVLNKEICKTTPTPTSGAFKRKCGQKETEIVLPKGKIPPIEELVFGVTYIECEEKTVDGHCSQFNCCQVSLNKDGKTVTKSACQFKGEKICTSPKPQPPVQVKRTTTMLPPKKPTICKKNQTSISGFCKPTKKKFAKNKLLFLQLVMNILHIQKFVFNHVKQVVIVMEKESVFVNMLQTVIAVL